MYWFLEKICYNLSRDVMARKKINVYTKLNNIEQSNTFYAIINDNVIKYIDLENNKMIVDLNKLTIIRENNDYLFNIDFQKEIISIYIKKLKKTIYKEIMTLLKESKGKSFLIRYYLTDEKEINEYYINF